MVKPICARKINGASPKIVRQALTDKRNELLFFIEAIYPYPLAENTKISFVSLAQPASIFVSLCLLLCELTKWPTSSIR